VIFPSVTYAISFEILELTSTSPVETYYEPPFSGSSILEAPLKRDGGTLTIGYGSGGMPPFSYTVQGSFNIGFLKLLVSTRPIHSTAGTWPCPCRLETDGPHTLDGGESWGALTIPMIQRRSPAPTFINMVVSKCPPTGIHSLSSVFPSSLRYLNSLNLSYTL